MALRPLDDYRIAGWVRVQVDGRPVSIYVVHLNFTDATGAARARQIADLLAFVDATHGDTPVLIGGDFNTAGNAAELAPLHADYFDAYAAVHERADAGGASEVTLNPHYHALPQRIDLIHASRQAFGPLQARRILDRPTADGLWPSDHFGIWARLRFAAAGERSD